MAAKYLIKNLDTGESFFGMNEASRSIGNCEELIRQAIVRAGLANALPPYEFESHGYRWLCTTIKGQKEREKGRKHYGMDKKILAEWPKTKGSLRVRMAEVGRRVGLSAFAVSLWLHYNGYVKTSEEFRERLFVDGRLDRRLSNFVK